MNNENLIASQTAKPSRASIIADLAAEDAPDTAATSGYGRAVFVAMQGRGRNIYAGTVPAATVQKRRRRNKAARATRRAQRRG